MGALRTSRRKSEALRRASKRSNKLRILATPVDVKAKSLAFWRPRSTSKPNASHSGDPRRRQSQKPSILATPVDVKAKSLALWRPRSTSKPKASHSCGPWPDFRHPHRRQKHVAQLYKLLIRLTFFWLIVHSPL